MTSLVERPLLPLLSGRFRAQVAATPDGTAVEAAGARLTYEELDDRVERAAAVLAAAGAGPERIVATALPRSPDLVVALLAALRSGAAYLPIDPDLPQDRVAYMLDDAAPVAVVHDDSTVRMAEHAALAIHSSALSAGRGPGPTVAADPASPIYVMYTSGSTGRPKGVVMSVAAIDNLLAWHLGELEPGPGRRVAQFTAIGFDISAQEILSTLLSGATLVIPSENTRRDPARLARWLDARRITDLFAPNIVVEAVCQASLAQGLALPDLRHVAQAGEQLTLGDDVRRFFRLRPGRRLYNHYGPTETHAATGYTLPGDPADWPARAPIGRPISHTDVRLLGAGLDEVSDGTPGEVHVSGAALARGYHDRPDLTAERFLPDPVGAAGTRMYRTGDVARRLPDGMLEYLGRADHQVKIRGIRIELGEIDAAVRAHPAVRDVAVVARGQGADARIDAYVVPAPGTRDPADVVDAVRERARSMLPAVMVPATWTVLPELPSNANGKVDRAALPAPDTVPAVNPVPGPSDRGTALAALCAECLDADASRAIAPSDDLFLLGLHSLSAARLATRIREVTGLDISVADIFRNATVAQLDEILRRSASDVPPVRALGRDVRAPASFAQERLWILDQFAGPGVVYNVPVVVTLRGELDVAAVTAAVCDVVRRHEPLRTTVVADAAGVRQDVAPDVDVELHRGPGTDIGAAARRPFDLARELPVRAHLFGSGDEHVLLVLIHHIAVDGWSIKPLAKDLAFAYAARRVGMAPPWRALPVAYRDYAAWQRELFDPSGPSAIAARQAAFWRSTLTGMPDVLAARTDHPRPAVLSAAGDRIGVEIPADVHLDLVRTAARSGCTVFMLVHAALSVLLHERGAGDDVVVGAAVAGRLDGSLDDLVGFFVNTLPLRVDLSGGPSLPAVVARVAAVDIEALRHQELPFDRIVDTVNPERTMAWSPLVQVMLAFQIGLPVAPRISGLGTALTMPSTGTSKFDLTVELAECVDDAGAPAGVRGHLEFSTDLYETSTARAMATRLTELLRSIVDQLGLPAIG